MTDELLPCPFCGSDAILLDTKLVIGFQYFISCNKCRANGPGFTNDRNKAITSWNTRADLDVQKSPGENER